ncbi:DUF1292 domain-containing protein [Maledivibacter halophilus]|uniref:DUF1292 domain-containing protein n=1 Tax=Maledivibacter halophilus TaxID=36842 RepID=A0A1T5MNA1_9FIRM|nr:DUF1292 domain-containing protein [Maledivibacter halophilus]SKC89388.1 Protein of unknown function [Maledivibacter halophilus]
MNNEKNHDCKCGCNDHHAEEKHECGCGCGGHSHHEVEMIYLTLGDGTELACKVLAIFEIKDKEYIALLPEGGEDVYLYGYKESEEGPMISQIEKDEEYALASEAFLSLCE